MPYSNLNTCVTMTRVFMSWDIKWMAKRKLLMRQNRGRKWEKGRGCVGGEKGKRKGMMVQCLLRSGGNAWRAHITTIPFSLCMQIQIHFHTHTVYILCIDISCAMIDILVYILGHPWWQSHIAHHTYYSILDATITRNGISVKKYISVRHLCWWLWHGLTNIGVKM